MTHTPPSRSGQAAAFLAGIVFLFLGVRSVWESFQAGSPVFRLKIHSIVEGDLAVVITLIFLLVGSYLLVSGYKGIQDRSYEA